MPRATQRLSRSSSPDAIRSAISSTIAELVKSGYDQKQASAIAYKEAREKTGEGLKRAK